MKPPYTLEDWLNDIGPYVGGATLIVVGILLVYVLCALCVSAVRSLL